MELILVVVISAGMAENSQNGVSRSLNDNLDIARKKRAICIRANMLSRKFFKCTPNIKALLFKSYCSNVYCVHLWANYAQYHLAKLSVLQ